MQKYNDYENAVYGYLKNYNEFKAQSESLGIELAGIDEQIRTIGAAKIARYGGEFYGGDGEFTPTERAAAKLEGLRANLVELQSCKQSIDTLLKKLDCALESAGEGAQIVRRKFIEGQRWSAISMETGYSERNCIRLLRKAVRTIARILFGRRMGQEQMRFEFVFLNPQ